MTQCAFHTLELQTMDKQQLHQKTVCTKITYVRTYTQAAVQLGKHTQPIVCIQELIGFSAFGHQMMNVNFTANFSPFFFKNAKVMKLIWLLHQKCTHIDTTHTGTATIEIRRDLGTDLKTCHL